MRKVQKHKMRPSGQQLLAYNLKSVGKTRLYVSSAGPRPHVQPRNLRPSDPVARYLKVCRSMGNDWVNRRVAPSCFMWIKSKRPESPRTSVKLASCVGWFRFTLRPLRIVLHPRSLQESESHLWHGELAGPWAVVGVKRLGRYNPFAPANISKVHFQVPPCAVPGLVPLLLSRLFNRLLVELQQGHLVPLVLASLFPRPTGLLVFKRFVRAGLVPAGRLVGILGPGEFIVLQWEQNVHRAFLPRLPWLLLLSVILLTQSQFMEAVWSGALPSHWVVSLEGGYHALRLWNGRVIGVDQDVGRAVWQELLPRLGPLRSHVDPNEQLVVVLGLVDHTGYVLPLPGYEVPVERGHIDSNVSESPHLVIRWGKTPDDHVDVAVPPGAVATTAFGPGAALGAVVEVSDVIMKSGRQNVFWLGERGEVKNLQLLLVDGTCIFNNKETTVITCDGHDFIDWLIKNNPCQSDTDGLID